MVRFELTLHHCTNGLVDRPLEPLGYIRIYVNKMTGLEPATVCTIQYKLFCHFELHLVIVVHANHSQVLNSTEVRYKSIVKWFAWLRKEVHTQHYMHLVQISRYYLKIYIMSCYYNSMTFRGQYCQMANKNNIVDANLKSLPQDLHIATLFPNNVAILLWELLTNNWCRWWELNPHGIATNRFWVYRVCLFHHTCLLFDYIYIITLFSYKVNCCFYQKLHLFLYIIYINSTQTWYTLCLNQ